MRFLKKVIKILLIIFVPIILLLYLFDYDYILKGVRVVYFTGHTSAFIDDHSYFDNRVIKKSVNPIPWKKHKEYNSIQPTDRLETFHKKLGTVAYLIIKNDSLWHEMYTEGYGATSQTNSFSMAKSIVTFMLGKAIMNKEINELNEPVGTFLPEFSNGLAKEMTVGDLSAMASGLNWDESYSSPFSITARSYYTKNLREVILGLKTVEQPGQYFEYLSGNTQVLAMAIEAATNQELSSYLTQYFWDPMGMEQDALWQLDSEENGLEKAYCCISSNARDFARFGSMINHEGSFNGKEILPASFIKKITTNRFEDSPEYGYGLWLSDHLGKKIVVMRGILGQYVIAIPEDQVVIVRLGHKRGKFVDKPFKEDFYVYVEEAYKMMEKRNLK
ncbi:serine hydrolase domain-containing protein [Aquimarina rhabdastrellae]